jgi:inorganic phosphate transporter, PiT family
MEILLAVIAIGVALANGANDNFKGFATVWGSGILDYRKALVLATLATLAGSFAALWLASGLVAQFSGRGLVSAQLAASTGFLLAVGAGVALTVALATRIGFPISTTHALIGGLVGAALAHESALVWAALGKSFFLPLLLSPVISMAVSWALSGRLREKTPDLCICLTPSALTPAFAPIQGDLMPSASVMPSLQISEPEQCSATAESQKTLLSTWLDRSHLASATSICFARAVNDTPKIAALLLAAQLTSASYALVWIGLAMAVGGFIGARRVAHTMSHRISSMTTGQGLLSNVVTSSLVLLASVYSLPVSTTHVSVGSIAGTAIRTNQLNRSSFTAVLLSWVATLPIAALSAYVVATIILLTQTAT